MQTQGRSKVSGWQRGKKIGPQKTVKEQQASAPPTQPKLKKKKKKTAQKTGSTAQEAQQIPKEASSSAENVPEGFDPAVSRAENRHRFTSRAHRKGSDEARKKGLQGEERLAYARTFSQKASQEFELLWPKLKAPDTEEGPPPAGPKAKKACKKKRKNSKSKKASGKKHKREKHDNPEDKDQDHETAGDEDCDSRDVE